MTDWAQRPREAAVAIVSFINHRNPNVNLLAISVWIPSSGEEIMRANKVLAS